MVSLIQTTIAAVLGPLVAELAAVRQAGERKDDRIAELERENGRLEERLALTASPESPQAGSGGPITSDPTPQRPLLARLRPLTPWVFGLLAVVAVVVLLTVPC
jgi:hypothetical protein